MVSPEENPKFHALLYTTSLIDVKNHKDKGHKMKKRTKSTSVSETSTKRGQKSQKKIKKK